MKKNVLRVFSLILLALVTCTILSTKIEEEMLLEVIGYEKKASYATVSMPTDMYFKDEMGMHLYEVYEGTGWESGLRTREAQMDGGGYFMTDRDYIIVRGASRQPVYGELAELYDGKDTAPATYLAFYPNGIPEENEMLFQAEILEQSEHVLLLYVEDAAQPFMENRVKGGLIQLTASDWRIYSLEALTQLLEHVPMAMITIVILIALGVFGLITYLLARNPDKNKALLIGNIFFILCLLASLSWVLNQIDLPASMLPSENIFRVSHYRTLCGEIFDALEELASETTRTYQVFRSKVLQEGMTVLLLGMAGILAGAVLELLWCGRKSVRKKRYVGNYLSPKKNQ